MPRILISLLLFILKNAAPPFLIGHQQTLYSLHFWLNTWDENLLNFNQAKLLFLTDKIVDANNAVSWKS